MSFLVPERVAGDEILDGDVPVGEAEDSLADIEWVHRRLGGTRTVRRAFTSLAAALPQGDLTLLDVGCGSGHVGRDVAGALASIGRGARVLGLDRKVSHARLARPGSLAADAFALPFTTASVDVVFSTLLVHHIAPEDLGRLLAEWARVARRAVLVLDLARNRLALAVVSVIGPLAFKSRISVLDGKASVRQAYTKSEMSDLAATALPGAIVDGIAPFTWRLLWLRPEA